MKIVKKSTVNQNKGRSGQVPVMIVCHRTCGSFDGAVSWLQNPESQASSHFVVAKDGRVVQLVEIEDTAWCNGTSKDSGSSRYFKKSTLEYVRGNGNNANSYTVSIEFEGLSNENGELTDEQFQAGVELVQYIVTEIKKIYDHDLVVSMETLVGHCHITPEWKPNCPGDRFPFNKMINLLERSINMKEKRVFNINGVEQSIDCIIINGVTYSPVRAIAEQLKAVVIYDSQTKITTIKNN